MKNGNYTSFKRDSSTLVTPMLNSKPGMYNVIRLDRNPLKFGW